MTHAKRYTLLKRLFTVHHGALRAFIVRRVASTPDVADLVQEVYLQMLRTGNMQDIRDSEAYLFAVAGNLIKKHAVFQRRHGFSVDIDDSGIQEELIGFSGFDAQVDADIRARQLRDVLFRLSPKCRAAVIMQYQHGMTYKEIAERLHVCHHRVKKYLATALALCLWSAKMRSAPSESVRR